MSTRGWQLSKVTRATWFSAFSESAASLHSAEGRSSAGPRVWPAAQNSHPPAHGHDLHRLAGDDVFGELPHHWVAPMDQHQARPAFATATSGPPSGDTFWNGLKAGLSCALSSTKRRRLGREQPSPSGLTCKISSWASQWLMTKADRPSLDKQTCAGPLIVGT